MKLYLAIYLQITHNFSLILDYSGKKRDYDHIDHL